MKRTRWRWLSEEIALTLLWRRGREDLGPQRILVPGQRSATVAGRGGMILEPVGKPPLRPGAAADPMAKGMSPHRRRSAETIKASC